MGQDRAKRATLELSLWVHFRVSKGYVVRKAHQMDPNRHLGELA